MSASAICVEPGWEILVDNFQMNGEPKAQPRTKSTRSGRHYTPATAKFWRQRVAIETRHLRPASPIDEPVAISLTLYLPRPKRLMRKADPAGPVVCGAKPDFDNLAKAIVDELKDDGWFTDDCRVADAIVRKRYHAKGGCPGMEMSIWRWAGAR